ncbi:hypothetical protein [Simkania sp.]|uniref:hypothetical protein n=1 Tax=Simkania sp. TaxID=34094 RepID=UPI003B52A2E7
MPTNDKVALYQAFLQIQTEFGENGAELNEVIEALETTLGLHKGIKSSFPLELKELISEPISGELGPIAEKLAAFEQDHLIPAIQNATTSEELLLLEPLLDQYIELKPQVISADADSRLEQSHSKMIGLWNAKIQKTNPKFAQLVTYEKGKLGDLSAPERRLKIATNIEEYIQETIKSFDHPTFKQEEKIALYEAVLKIQSEFQEHGDGKLLEPTAKALRQALSIPEPELPKPKLEPKAKKGIFAMWENKSSNSSPDKSSSPMAPVARKKAVASASPDVRRQKALQIIQEKLGSLDLQSHFLRDHVLDIKSQIRILRSISGDPTEFKHLETALDALLNPAPFVISEEENIFIQFIGKKHKILESQLQDYQDQEKATVINAQSSLLKTLKKSIAKPELLDATAQRALATETANAKQMRFRRFTDLHKPNPALSQNFAAHYPALIQTFELFTREVLSPSIEGALV